MTRFRHWLVASLVLCFSTTAHAQTRTVSGSVHDADTGEPLVGAQIAVRGNPTLGTLARNDGNFSSGTAIPVLATIEDPEVAAAQRASIFPFPGRGMDRSAVLRGGFFDPGNGKGRQ